MTIFSGAEVLANLDAEVRVGKSVLTFSKKWVNTHLRPHAPELADKMIALHELHNEILTAIVHQHNANVNS